MFNVGNYWNFRRTSRYRILKKTKCYITLSTSLYDDVGDRIKIRGGEEEYIEYPSAETRIYAKFLFPDTDDYTTFYFPNGEIYDRIKVDSDDEDE